VTGTLRAWTKVGDQGGRPLLLGLLGLGLVVRLIHFATLTATPFPRFPLVLTQTDLHATWQWAGTILAGDLIGRDPYHPYFDWMRAIAPQETWYRWFGGREIFQQAPFYAYWVAGLLAISGRSLAFVLFVQLVVGALTPLVVFALAQHVFADRRVSLLAAGWTALYGPLVFFQGTLLRDWLPPLVEPLVLVATLRAIHRGRDRDWLVVGALGGFALLVKESALLLFPVLLIWLLRTRPHDPRRMARAAVVLGLGAALALAPLVLRNVAVGAPPLALSNRFAEGVIEGNAADVLPAGMAIPPSMRGILERSDGRLGGVIRETLGTYRGQWWRLGGLQLTKLRALVDPFEIPNNLNLEYGREISPILRWLPGYGVLFPLAVAGLLVTLRGSGSPHGLLGLYTLAMTAGLLAGPPVLSRYRIALVPAMAIYAAAGVVRAWDAARRRDHSRWVAYAALAAASALVQQWLAPIPELRNIPEAAVHAIEYGAAAQLYAQAGQFDRALAEIQRLRRRADRNPGFTRLQATAAGEEIEVRTQFAAQLIARQRLREARQHVDMAARLIDAHPGASHRLANLGALYAKLGEPARAADYLRRFLQREPDDPLAGQVRQLLLRLGPAG
jgi:tetratricopeptide (TPR) repeat protein